MPSVPLKFVVSFSSQDERHTAENMVKGKSNLKWLSHPANRTGKLEGVFQLECSCIIDHIDIGAYMCLSVEVLVGRSSWPQDHKYRSLVPSSICLTPNELKQESNKCCVKMFVSENFDNSVRNEPWDRIKVICNQTLRKDVQFGLCFLRILGRYGSSVADSSTVKPGHELQGHSLDAKVRGGAPSPATEVIKTHFYGSKHDRSDTFSAPAKWSRAGQMLYAAAGNTPRNKSYSANEALAATQEDHHRKSFEGEIMSYLKKRNLKLIDLDKGLDYSDLRHQFEKERMHKLTPEEKESFVEVTNRYFSTLSESPKQDTHTNKLQLITDDQSINSLDDISNDTIFSSLSSNSNGLVSRLHPSIERKTDSKVQIYRDQPNGFDIHATVNGSPIKTLLNKKTLVNQQSYSAKKKFSFVTTPRDSSPRLSDNLNDQSVPCTSHSSRVLLSPMSKSEPTKVKETHNISPVYSVNGHSRAVSTPDLQPRKKLFFKKSTPFLKSSEKSTEDEPKSAYFKDIFGVTPSELRERTQTTPSSTGKSCSKRKLLEDTSEDTNDVWLSKVPPPRITKRHPRHSDIIPLPQDESADLPDLENGTKDENLPQCPICMSHFPAAELEQHAAACARVAFGDGKSRIPDTPPCGSKPPEQDVVLLGSLADNSSEPSVECPICGNFFLDSKIQEHANQCADMCQAAFT